MDYQKGCNQKGLYTNITDKGLYYYKKSLTIMKNASAYNNIIRIYIYVFE